MSEKRVSENEEACHIFGELLRADPHRIENMDKYADALFVLVSGFLSWIENLIRMSRIELLNLLLPIILC